MKLKALKTQKDHSAALARLESIFDARPGTPAGDEAEVLMILIEAYERGHYPIEAPDPVEAIRFRMEQQGLKQADIAPYMGGKTRVSEILNRKRSLTIDMIRSLHENLGIPYESLIGQAAQTGRKGKVIKMYKENAEQDMRSVADPRTAYKKQAAKRSRKQKK
jgi:HTH-type transcriptional regulator / antitoxin HigA